MINENRRREIMNRLKQEREDRIKLLDQDESTIYLDDSLIHTPTIGNYSQISNSEQSSRKSEICTPLNQKLMQEKRAKLAEIKKQLEKQKKPAYYDPVIERLAEPKTIIIQERQLIKEQKDQLQFENTCTFQPEMNEQSEILAQVRYQKYENIPVYERMKYLENERLAHIEEIRLMLKQEQEEIEEPEQRVPKPFVNGDVPIYERYQQVMQEKKALLQCLKVKQLQEEEDFYVPKINPKSQILAEIMANGVDVVERLHNDAIQRQEYIPPQEEEFDFIPQTNKQQNDYLVKGDFEQRQEQFLQKQMQKIQQKEEQVYMNYTFQPKISQASEALVKRESKEKLFEKLHDDYQAKLTQLKEKQQQQIEELNFHPELNPKSMEMAADRNLDDLIKNEYGEYRKQLLKEKYEEKNSECSFYPSVSTTHRYSQIHSQYSYDDCSERIKLQQAERDERRAKAQQEMQLKQLEQCTFKPSIQQRQVNNERIPVNGMEAYMLKVDQARKQKDQQKMIENKLFERHNQYDSQQHKNKTTTKPFKLSETQQNRSYCKNRNE